MITKSLGIYIYYMLFKTNIPIYTKKIVYNKTK